MAKRTGSSARVEHAPRRAVRKDGSAPKAGSIKTTKRRSAPHAPESTAIAKGTKKRAVPEASKSTAIARAPKKRAVPEAPKSTAIARRARPIAAAPESTAHAKRTATKTTAGSSRRAARGSRRGFGSVSPLPPPGHESARLPPRIPTPPPPAEPRSMELEWTGDPGGSSPPEEGVLDRWVRRGDELLLRLAKHGAADHEVRANLGEGRFYWVDPFGRVSAEAHAKLVCTFVPQTSSVTMGWADASTRHLALPRAHDLPAEVDGADEEAAWRIAMAAAEGSCTEYLYRVRSPAQCLFLALSSLTFAPTLPQLVPSTPVSMVLATLGDTRAAAELGAEPVDTLRARLSAAGATLLEQAEYVHKDTDWVARLVRTGKRLGALADRLPRPTFFSVAKGSNTVWLDPRLAEDLVESIALLEEEWQQFA